MYIRFFKPFSDILTSCLILIVLSPILVITTVIISIVNKGNPFFFQKRPGRNAKIFKLYKFKTMIDAFDQHGSPLPDHLRITKIGSIIRATSLDELLQLINVIKGDMSLIGPRPLLVQYLDRYSIEQARRHLVKPGITGWAQVNGRNSISWQEKFQLDNDYVKNVSFLLDLKIIFMTLKSVFKRSDINQSENITMSEFMGNN